jgi:hypothetical protein
MRIVASALSALAFVTLAAPAARAEDSAAATVRYAVFTGTASPRTGGTASACHEILTGSTAPFACDASFTITAKEGVCSVKGPQTVGTFDYFSPTTGFSMQDVPLTVTGAVGAGYLVSEGIQGTHMFSVRISIAGLCDFQGAGPFEGGVAYI